MHKTDHQQNHNKKFIEGGIINIIRTNHLLMLNKMTTEKEDILEMIKALPNNISMEDIIEAIYVRKKIEKGLRDSKDGKLFTHEEAKERLGKWLK